MAAVIEWLIIIGLAAAAVYVLRYERPDPAAGGRPGVGGSRFVRFARMASDRARALVGQPAGEHGTASPQMHEPVDLDTDQRALDPLAEAG